jgi:transposase-like protein
VENEGMRVVNGVIHRPALTKMEGMEAEVKQRLGWIKLYEQTGDPGFVCRRCGIARPTLRLWWRRYQEDSANSQFTSSSIASLENS